MLFREHSEKVRKRMVFHGTVQGVGFRWQARRAAEELGLTGWVRNETDGTVTMEVQGTEEKIGRLLAELEGDRWIRIESVEERQIPLAEKEKWFSVQSFW